MNSVLDVALANVITKAVNSAEAAGAFLISEIPDVVQQTLLWYGVYHALTMFFGIIGILLIPYLGKKYVLRGIGMVEADKVGNPTGVFLAIFSFFGAIGGVACSLSYMNLVWLKIWLAPKLWLIEYATELTKKLAQ